MGYCTFIPEKGTDTFLKLKDMFGQKIAADIYNVIVSDSFKKDYTLELDSEGFPTLDSILNNELVVGYISDSKNLESLNSRRTPISNTIENNTKLVNECIKLNEQNPYLINFVDYAENGDLVIKTEVRNEENVEIAKNQKKILDTNAVIKDTLGSLGITVGMLSEIEVAAGRVGHTNFSHISEFADGFSSLIRIANNMEGAKALSEEFSHFIIGLFRNKPMVKRAIDYLSSKEDYLKKILGEDYDNIVEYHNGDMAMVAEEALGHLLRDKIDETIAKKQEKFKPHESIFKRALNFIVNMFKNLNPFAYERKLERIKKDMESLASDVVNKKETITKEMILNSKREAEFNALSEKVDLQADVLKKITDSMFKLSKLYQNLTDKNLNPDERFIKKATYDKVSELKEKIDICIKCGETAKGVYKIVENIKTDINAIQKSLSHLSELSDKDKFITLQNCSFLLQAYEHTVKILREITGDEFFLDPAIKDQHFLIEDLNESLSEFESKLNSLPEVHHIFTNENIDEQISIMQGNSKKFNLTEDEKAYELKEEEKDGRKKLFKRVTDLLKSDSEFIGLGEKLLEAYKLPSTTVGNTMDLLVRDFFSNPEYFVKTNGVYYYQKDGTGVKIDLRYPNSNEKNLSNFIDDLFKLKKSFDEKGIRIIPNDITVNGIVNVVDSTGVSHGIRVAGTLDLLGVDKNGNYHIFDMKTHRSSSEDFLKDNKKLSKYRKQLFLYKKFLQEMYGIKVVSTSIIPIHTFYPEPKGAIKENKEAGSEYSIKENQSSLLRENTQQLNIKYHGKDQNLVINPTLEEVIPMDTDENIKLDLDYVKLTNDATGGFGSVKYNIIDSINTISRLYDKLSTEYDKVALPTVVEYFSSYVGNSFRIYDKHSDEFKQVSLEDLFKSMEGDIGGAYQFFSLAANPDMLLQIFDRIYKYKMDSKQERMVEMQQKIIMLGKKYEELGIKNYDFMFEEDNMNYVTFLEITDKKTGKRVDYSYNQYEYNQALDKFKNSLDEKYGKNLDSSDENYIKKKEELNKWISKNTIKLPNTYETVPNPKIYPAKKLTDLQKKFYSEFMEIKETCDSFLGYKKTRLTNSIKIRRKGLERVKGLLNKGVLTSAKGAVAEAFKKNFDDEFLYTEEYALKGFNNEEIYRIPMLYLNCSEEQAKDVTHDCISSLLAYADSCIEYNELTDISDAFEVARKLALKRKIAKYKGNKKLVEKKYGDVAETIYIDTATSNFYKALNQFVESKLYKVTMVDNGTIIGTDTNKVVNTVLSLSSATQLGFNALAQVMNLITGVTQQFIDGVASSIIKDTKRNSIKDLMKADKTFFSHLPGLLANLESRTPKNKLKLFVDLLNIRQKGAERFKNFDFTNRTIIGRLFGPSIQFLGQDAGDFYLYTRTAIAAAQKYKLYNKVTKKEISLFDALEVVPVDKKHPSYGYKLQINPNVVKKDGTPFSSKDKSDFIRRVNDYNQDNFGVYSEEDRVMARRYIWGRFIMQYRDFMPSMLRRRFAKKYTSLAAEEIKTGSFEEAFIFLKNMTKGIFKGGKYSITEHWKSLSEEERFAIHRCWVEVVLILLMMVVRSLLGGWDDKNKPWLKRIFALIAARGVTENAFYSPFEASKILASPVAASSPVQDWLSLVSLFDPDQYRTIVRSGKYKGHTKAYRTIRESNLPGLSHIRNIERLKTPELITPYYYDYSSSDVSFLDSWIDDDYFYE